MANESTSSTLSELYTEIVAEAQFVASEKSIMRNLVKNYAITGGGKAVEVPVYAQVSVHQQFQKQLTYQTQRLTQLQ
jgi:hypothetical protein